VIRRALTSSALLGLAAGVFVDLVRDIGIGPTTLPQWSRSRLSSCLS
jgi:hypothetical protein